MSCWKPAVTSVLISVTAVAVESAPSPGQQPYDAGDIAAIDAAANAERLSAAAMWAAQGGPNGLTQVPQAGKSAEVTRRIFELGRAAMMREEQEVHGAAATSLTAAPTVPAQMMTPQQLAMNAPSVTVPPTGTEAGTVMARSQIVLLRDEVGDVTSWPTQYLRSMSERQALVQARL